jgi:hypothetical protein
MRVTSYILIQSFLSILFAIAANSFKEAIFYDKVHFGAAKFHQEADFIADFQQEVNFRQSYF